MNVEVYRDDAVALEEDEATSPVALYGTDAGEWPSHEMRGASRFVVLAPALAVVLVAALVYINTLWNGFALDDVYIIQKNARVHQLASQSLLWLKPYWPFYGHELGLYRPLTMFNFAAQWVVGGGAAWPFHAMNVVLNALVSLLVFLLLRRLAGTGAALVGGLLFAVHPLHTEAVANIVGQAELVVAACVVGGCLVHATRPTVDVGWGRRSVLVLLFAIAMLEKESAVVMPGLLVALDFGQRRVTFSRVSLWRYARAMAVPIFLLAATLTGYFALRVSVLGSIGGVNAAPNLPFLRQEHRVLVAFRAWPEYVRLLFFPSNLSSDYSPGVILPVQSLTPMAGLGLLLLAGTTMLALATPLLPAAGLPAAWFLIAIFPTSNLLLPIGVVVAERLLYLPSVAVAFVAAFTWRHLAHTRPRARMRAWTAGLIGVLVLMGIRTWVRNPDWASTDAVWDAILRDHPESYRSQGINAARMLAKGNKTFALKYMEMADRIWPYDSQMMLNLGLAYVERADYERAIGPLERARKQTPFARTTNVLLAYSYLSLHRPREAMPAIVRGAAVGEDAALLLALRAQVYEQEGRTGEAVGTWRAALKLPAPDYWTFRAMLARDLARLGLTGAALAEADSAIAAAPDAEAAELGRLRGSIAAGCFPEPAKPEPLPEPGDRAEPASPARGAGGQSHAGSSRSGCDDPLAGWSIVLPWQAPENANASQNASVAAAGDADPASMQTQ